MEGSRATRRRWLRRCGVIGIAGFAGCIDESGSESDDPDGESETTNDESETADDGPSDIAFPPGLSEDGLQDLDALFDAHERTVTASSFTVAHEERFRQGSSDEWEIDQTNRAFEVFADPTADRVEAIEYDGPIGTAIEDARYIDGDRGAALESSSVRQQTADGITAEPFDEMRNWLRHVQAEYEGLTTIESRTVHEIRVTEIDRQYTPGDRIEDDGIVLADEDGRIHEFRLVQTGESDQRVQLEATFEFYDFGETVVERPDWAGELEETGLDRIEIDPGTRIELSAETAGWGGVEPASIADLENPTLGLEAGGTYVIGWSTGDGSTHNIELRNDDDEVVDDLSTDLTHEADDGQWLEFVATEELESYVCAPHEHSMRGEIRVE